MFKYLLSKFQTHLASFEDPQTRLSEEMLQHPSKHDLNKLFPIILPAALLQITWPGPIIPLGDLPFSLTWAIAGKDHRFLYINAEMQTYWENNGVDWRAHAKDNLIRIASCNPDSGEKCDDSGKPFIKAMLTEDSMGPSRLLVPYLFEKEFGRDYLVAIPEQTCAIAYRLDLNIEQQETVDDIIDGCFTDGTEPMSPERFRPERFWVL